MILDSFLFVSDYEFSIYHCKYVWKAGGFAENYEEDSIEDLDFVYDIFGSKAFSWVGKNDWSNKAPSGSSHAFKRNVSTPPCDICFWETDSKMEYLRCNISQTFLTNRPKDLLLAAELLSKDIEIFYSKAIGCLKKKIELKDKELDFISNLDWEELCDFAEMAEDYREDIKTHTTILFKYARSNNEESA